MTPITYTPGLRSGGSRRLRRGLNAQERKKQDAEDGGHVAPQREALLAK